MLASFAAVALRWIDPMGIPDWWNAPTSLLQIDGHCGLLAAWQVLRHYGKRASSMRLAAACGHTKRHGVFTIGLAAGLTELGLAVEFHSEFDGNVGPTERRAPDPAAFSAVEHKKSHE